MLDKMAKELADRLSALEEQYDRLDDQGRCDYLLLKKIQDLRGQLRFPNASEFKSAIHSCRQRAQRQI
jgi:hypothetical protein